MTQRVFPCPHTRDLTDDELDRIAAEGWRMWKAQIKKDNEEWKDNYDK